MAITEWPVPVDAKGLRNFLRLAAHLHECSRNYADVTIILSCILKKIGSGHVTITVIVHLKVSSRA